MPFPARLLHPDEDVLLDQRPHTLRLVFPALVSAAVLGAILAGFLGWRRAPDWFGALLGTALVGVCAYFGSRYARWASTNLVVSSHRIIYRSGVLSAGLGAIPIDAVQSVSFRQSILGRLARIGTLTVESAGEQGEQSVPDVRDPEAAQAVVHRAIESAASRRAQPPAGAVGDLAGQLERLDALQRRGVITAEEFERAKRDLLGGP